ncbi:MAG TPA: hypothetical protein VNQ99_05530 [Xanthobacteraceae bacterium]|nr:hypothetical protein [Xanthobacteraceae bacterium]
MDEMAFFSPGNTRAAVTALVRDVCAAIEAAREVSEPFFHLEMDRVFPPEVYRQMVALMPVAADYRPMSGRSKGHDLADGTHTRVKIDLFPEYIRHLPEPKRQLWTVVGQALCSDEVRRAFMRKLAPGLAARHGENAARVGMYPIPVLTRDTSGYLIPPHTDTHWKGITVQLYLPPDESIAQVGTIFDVRNADGSFAHHTRMKFSPNTGYAFAVGDDTWHSAEPVDIGNKSRDSILLTYFVDQGALRLMRNRGKRLGNFLLNEWRYRTR